MDYNDFELVAFWVLCFGAAVPLVAVGVLVQLRRGVRARDWYMFLGCVGSIAYGCFAGPVVDDVFPPPYVPGLYEGRGLDLRGTFLVIGSWIGGILGVVATVATILVSRLVHWRRQRKTAMPGDVHTP